MIGQDPATAVAHHPQGDGLIQSLDAAFHHDGPAAAFNGFPHEAIRILQTLDIVEVRHGRATFVGNMSLQPPPAHIELTACAHGDIPAVTEAGDVDAYRRAVHSHCALLLGC